MSFTRRLAAGIPAVGVTVLAALAFAGSPSNAAAGDAAQAVRPQVMASPCDDSGRVKCDGYGYGDVDDEPGVDDTDVPNDDDATDDATPGTSPTRGNGGYGGESPTAVPSTPPATANTVPPGVSPTTVAPSPSKTPGGVSAGGTLPVTGAPGGTTIGVGLLMVAVGGAAVWYTRRRRTA